MSFVYTVNPNGGVVYRRVVEKPFSNSEGPNIKERKRYP
jgi:hypothetical protein